MGSGEQKVCDHDWGIVEVWYGKPPYQYLKKRFCRKCFYEEIVVSAGKSA